MSPSKDKTTRQRRKPSTAPVRKTATKKSPAKTANKPAAKAAVTSSKSTVTATRPISRVVSRAADIDTKVRMVRELAAIVERRSLTELVVETKDATYRLRRGESVPPPQFAAPFVTAGYPPVEASPPPHPGSVEAVEPPVEGTNGEYHLVTSPFVGTFYRRPNPDADVYVEQGARVDKGQVLCIVEAMKLMNEIEADVAGSIVAILVSDGDPVEYGQPLFKLTPA